MGNFRQNRPRDGLPVAAERVDEWLPEEHLARFVSR